MFSRFDPQLRAVLRSGWKGLGEGFLKGVRGAVAQPVSGLMHGAQHIVSWMTLDQIFVGDVGWDFNVIFSTDLLFL